MNALVQVHPADPSAREIVEKNFILSIIVGAFPYPFIAGMALKALQLKMIYELTVEYRLGFSENLVKSIMLIIVAGFVASTAMSVFNRFVPRATPLGFATHVMVQAIASGAETYAIGHIMRLHFESGGTLEDFDLQKSKQHISKLYEEGKSEAKNAIDKKIKKNKEDK